MKIQMESTTEVTMVNSVPCRHWLGVTEDGIECDVFVHMIACRSDRDAREFDADLMESPPPPEYFRPLSEILS